MILGFSVASVYFLPNGFMPAEDSGRALLGVELPPGSRLADTEAVTEKISRRISARPDVKSAFVIGGTLLGSGDEVRKATLIINLVSEGSSASSAQSEIQQEIGRDLADIPDIRFFFMQDDGQRQLQLVVSRAATVPPCPRSPPT